MVSIIIPCYNHAQYLDEAIESVRQQTYTRTEIVVVDDGSPDNTSEVAGRYPGVRCIRQQNRGLSAARNMGLLHSTGSLLVFLDADDRLLPHAIETGERALQLHQECAFVYGHLTLIGPDGSPIPTPQQVCVESNHCLELLKTDFIWTPGVVMYRRAVFESVIGFNTLIDACADCDLNIRIARDWPVHCHGQVVLEYRKHGMNMSANAAVMLRTAMAAHRSQLKYVRGNKQLEDACRIGGRAAQEYFGIRLLNQWQREMVVGDLKHSVSGLLTLVRHYPRRLADLACRKLLRVLRAAIGNNG